MKKHKYEIELKDIELILNGLYLVERQIRDDEKSTKINAIDYNTESLISRLENIQVKYDRLDRLKSILSDNLPKILDDVQFSPDDIPF